ncbi:MAG: hypothetical protein AAF587_38885 [Bacteroidota bacterium]
MGLFSNLFSLPAVGYRVLRNAQRQRQQIQQILHPEILAARIHNDGSLSEKDYQKILTYYGYIIPAFLGDSYCILRGQSATEKEQLAITYQGAMTGLFDDFFDEKEMPEEELTSIIEDPYQLIGKDTNERLFLRFYRLALDNCKRPKLVQTYLRKVYDAQVLSLRQLLPETDAQEILDITLQKGGMSFLFYRAVYDHPLEEAEREMLFHVGGVMQLNSDVFDIYKDLHAGIRTLPTLCKDIRTLRNTISILQDKAFSLAYHCGYPRRQVRSFLRFLSLVNSRTFVCLDMLAALQKSTGGVFSPEAYERDALICDMETPMNMLRSVGKHLTYKMP